MKLKVRFELDPAEFTRPGRDERRIVWNPAFQPAFLKRYRETVGPAGAAAGRFGALIQVQVE